jgi:hypothetical protein
MFSRTSYFVLVIPSYFVPPTSYFELVVPWYLVLRSSFLASVIPSCFVLRSSYFALAVPSYFVPRTSYFELVVPFVLRTSYFVPRTSYFEMVVPSCFVPISLNLVRDLCSLFMKRSFEQAEIDLAIDEQLPMHERGWKVQRIGLLLILALVLCCSVGLFGDGVASTSKITGKTAEIEFERFYRFQAKMELKIEVNSETRSVVSIPTDYLKHFEIESIVPEPQQNEFNGKSIDYMFNGKGGKVVTFYLVPQQIGRVSAVVAVDGDSFALNHFIYP